MEVNSMFNTGNCASVPLVANIDGNGNNNGWGAEGSWLWFLIVVFAIFGGWGNGFGGFGGNGMNGGVGSEIQRGFDNQAVVSKLDGITNGLCDGFYAVQNGMNGINTNILQTGFGIQQAINADTVANMQNTNALQSQLANCCCETREAIQGVNYNMAQNTCALQNTMNNNTRDIIDSQNAGTRAILDFLTQDKIATLTAENNDLRRAASQDRQNALLTTAMSAQTSQILDAVRPTPVPAYPAASPCGLGNWSPNVLANGYYGNGCGCNTGCNC